MNQLLFERYLKNFRETLRENGIEKGDILYVASDLSGVLIDARRELEISSGGSKPVLRWNGDRPAGNGRAWWTVAVPGVFMGLLQGSRL